MSIREAAHTSIYVYVWVIFLWLKTLQFFYVIELEFIICEKLMMCLKC